MEDLRRMYDDLEKVIEKDDASTLTSSDCEDTLKHGPQTLRQKLDGIIHSNQFQVGVVVLVIFDVLLVLAELLFDLEIIKLQEHHQESVPHALHYCSITILSIFLLEISLRIFVMRLDFFKHKLEMFDTVVVVVSFVLDVVFRDKNDATNGVGLLVILRLWRITRILNGIILSVRRQAEKKVEREQHAREACEQELSKFRTYCSSLEAEIEYLHRLLREHGIPYTEKIQKRPVGHQISVEVEVNHRTVEEAKDLSGRGQVCGEPIVGLKSANDKHTSRVEGNGNAYLSAESARHVRPCSSVRVDDRDLSDIITVESMTES